MPNLYLVTVNHLVARILSMQNRNPMSATHGCLDRNFWHFKTIIDFPSATYQQVIAGLSRLYATAAENNIYYKQPVIAESIKAGILYWCEIQNRDGSFNEYYVNDRSFCPTAYTTYAAAEAYCLTKDMFLPQEQDLIESKLLKSACWLTVHSNSTVQNQMIASMNALYWVAKVSQDDLIHKAFKKRRLEILNSQNQEGWFCEYGGADIGYSFKALDLLSSYLTEVDDPEIFSSAVRLLDFSSNFLHPDGTCGGDYGSRCTQHVFPFGLEFLSARGVSTAQVALVWFRKHFKAQQIIHPAAIDDKYVLYFYFNSYVRAFLKYEGDDRLADGCRFNRPEVRFFKEAGLLCLQIAAISAWFSSRRNGVCRVFSGDRLVHSDCGYLIRLSNGDECATQCDDKCARMEYFKSSEGFCIRIVGDAGRVNDSLPLTKWLIPFKLFCGTLLRFEKLSYWFNDRLKSDRIAKYDRAPVRITRDFNLRTEGLIIKDTIEVTSAKYTIKYVTLIHDVTVTHSPSSRYYQVQYLQPRCIPRSAEESPARYRYEYEIAYDRQGGG